MGNVPATPALSREEMTALLRSLDEVYAAHDIEDDEKLTIYAVLSAFCRYQVEHQVGDFYEQVAHLLMSENSK